MKKAILSPHSRNILKERTGAMQLILFILPTDFCHNPEQTQLCHRQEYCVCQIYPEV